MPPPNAVAKATTRTPKRSSRAAIEAIAPSRARSRMAAMSVTATRSSRRGRSAAADARIAFIGANPGLGSEPTGVRDS